MPGPLPPFFVLALACRPDAATDSGAAASSAPTLAVLAQGRALTDLAEQAVAMSPAWVRHDLALSLRQVSSTRQDELAALIVDGDDPYIIDELAFSIAHVSPEVLDSSRFHPELLRLNAELIQARDADLDYVELVEVGEVGSDDWYTTTSYRIGTADGVVERQLDRDLYYWYVVHPRIEDEHPWFVDGFEICRNSSLECHEDAEGGMFWREFLWSGAEETCELDWCPVLRDWVGDATVLWDEADPGTSDGAIASIMSFMLANDETAGRWFSFGAGSERSIQPNRIYGLGAGNCGEWGDMTTALSRTALIPNLNVTPSSWDHTWNAFFAPGSQLWATEWIPWEPVNWWLVHAYGSGFATYTIRGDTLSWYMSDDYTPSFDMQVDVTDAAGDPVDGATISIWTPYGDGWWFAGETVTDATGSVAVPLGAGQDYAIQVGADQGWFPNDSQITYASSGVEAGVTDVVEVQLEGLLPAMEWTEVTLEGEEMVEVEVSLTIDGARIVRPSWRFEESFAKEVAAPEVDAFVVDADNFAHIAAGEPFEGAPVPGGTGTVSVPAEGRWYVVLPNLGRNTVALLGTLQATVPTDDGPDEATAVFELLAGDHVAIELAFD
ncbi:MAG: carboxypeptidase regulatory-like domain-containing protein [Alphaproteobacteria bacterium]|nr:carboxypeptidase regulatory-like domain-containing protein [Alphaproteobacteria bacterium]